MPPLEEAVVVAESPTSPAGPTAVVLNTKACHKAEIEAAIAGGHFRARQEAKAAAAATARAEAAAATLAILQAKGL